MKFAKVISLLLLCTLLSTSWEVLSWGQSKQEAYRVPSFAVEPIAHAPAHVQYAAGFSGRVKEVTKNAGPEINIFLAAVGLGPGYPYCSAFVSYILDTFEIDKPAKRSALSTAFISDTSYRAAEVLLGIVEPQPGDIVTWRKGNGIYGHTGFVIAWNKSSGVTVEANTSPGPGGSQRDGEGVWIKSRQIVPSNYFRIVSFTPVGRTQ